jgi:hypothetical protein
MTFDADELVAWRAVEAIGPVAADVFASDVEKVRALLRRVLWLMNDESGSLAWHAPETIGEVLVAVPALIGEYAELLTGYYRRPPFERGSHLATYRVGRVNAAPFLASVPALIRSLNDSDPGVRGYAALALGAAGASRARSVIEHLQRDAEQVVVYDFQTHRLRSLSVGEMAKEALALMRVVRSGESRA